MRQFLYSLFFCSLLGAESLEITGQDGKKTTIESPAKKVVIFQMPLTSMYIAIDDGAEHLVGIHADAKKYITEGVLKHAYPKAVNINTEVAKAGFTPNVEQVLSLKPDVVFQWGDQGDAIIEPLRNAGLNVVGLKYGSQELLEGWIEIMGKVSGNTQKAQSIIGWHKEQIERLKEKSKSVTKHPKIIVLFYAKDRLRVAGSGTYEDFYINLIGGVNPAKNLQRFADISEEQFLSYESDIIVLGTFDDEKPTNFMQRAIFKDMAAIKSKRVYKFPVGAYRWGPPNLEAPLMWNWLYQVAYPNDTIGFKTKLKDAYKFLYRYEIDDATYSEVLNFTDNKNSAYYDVFAK